MTGRRRPLAAGRPPAPARPAGAGRLRPAGTLPGRRRGSRGRCVHPPACSGASPGPQPWSARSPRGRPRRRRGRRRSLRSRRRACDLRRHGGLGRRRRACDHGTLRTTYEPVAATMPARRARVSAGAGARQRCDAATAALRSRRACTGEALRGSVVRTTRCCSPACRRVRPTLRRWARQLTRAVAGPAGAAVAAARRACRAAAARPWCASGRSGSR